MVPLRNGGYLARTGGRAQGLSGNLGRAGRPHSFLPSSWRGRRCLCSGVHAGRAAAPSPEGAQKGTLSSRGRSAWNRAAPAREDHTEASKASCRTKAYRAEAAGRLVSLAGPAVAVRRKRNSQEVIGSTAKCSGKPRAPAARAPGNPGLSKAAAIPYLHVLHAEGVALEQGLIVRRFQALQASRRELGGHDDRWGSVGAWERSPMLPWSDNPLNGLGESLSQGTRLPCWRGQQKGPQTQGKNYGSRSPKRMQIHGRWRLRLGKTAPRVLYAVLTSDGQVCHRRDQSPGPALRRLSKRIYSLAGPSVAGCSWPHRRNLPPHAAYLSQAGRIQAAGPPEALSTAQEGIDF